MGLKLGLAGSRARAVQRPDEGPLLPALRPSLPSLPCEGGAALAARPSLLACGAGRDEALARPLARARAHTRTRVEPG
eukprot:scaffold9808_cov18-Phaeocystis_antarctica.AAC.1